MPTDDVIRRFYRSKYNFWYTYKDMVAVWHLYYNSGELPQKIASGEGNAVKVINETVFEIFMHDIHNGGV